MRIRLSKQAIKMLNSQNVKTQERIKKGMARIPHGDIKSLQNMPEAFRLRVGDFRILFDIIDNVIVVNKILPRGSAYKK